MERNVFNPERIGMEFCSNCSGFRRKYGEVCSKCGGFGLIRIERAIIKRKGGDKKEIDKIYDNLLTKSKIFSNLIAEGSENINRSIGKLK